MKVIPVMRRDCEPPPLLASKLWADCRNDADFEASVARLLAVLMREPTSTLPTEAEGSEYPPVIGQILHPLSEAMKNEISQQVSKAVSSFLAKECTQASATLPASHADVDPQLCFIVMPFGSEELNIVYEDFVRPTIENQCELRCQRGDDLFGSEAIMEDIRRSIERARLVVADLTGKNANVFYEVGIAHTLERPVLLLSQSMSDVPFDLRHRRVLLYEYSPRGCKKLERHLTENVRAMLQRSQTTSA